MTSESAHHPGRASRDLIGEVIGLLQSPAKNVISALNAGNKLASLIKALETRPRPDWSRQLPVYETVNSYAFGYKVKAIIIKPSAGSDKGVKAV